MPQNSRFTSFHWGTYRAEGEGAALKLLPLPEDRAPSPIGPSLVASLDASCRVAQPHVREGWLHDPGKAGGRGRGAEPFVPVSWATALDLVAGELTRVRDAHGNNAIFAGSYGWASAGRFHHPQSQLHRFLNCFGGYTYSVNTYSFAAAEVIVPHVLGYALRPFNSLQTSWPVLAENVELFVAFGGVLPNNGQVSPGGAGPHIVEESLARCAARNTAFVNIGPIREDLPPTVNADWLPLRPNTDTALMLGLAHTLLEENLYDRAFLDRCTVGFGPFAAYLRGAGDDVSKSAEWAGAITGLQAETIRALARRMARARTFVSMSWSIQRGDHGEQPIWAGIALAAMLGQIGLPGGGFGIGYGCCNYIGNPAPKIVWPSLPQKTNPVRDFIPVGRISDLLLNPGKGFDYDGRRHVYPDIRLVYWAGGNPFHHHQDINKLIDAWRRPDTIIVNEPWWTATARHADIVLPVTTPLERNDIGAAVGEPLLVAMREARAPSGESRNDFDIFAGLAARLGFVEQFTEGRNELEWVEHLYARARQAAEASGIGLPSFETFWEEGIVHLPLPADTPVLFERFRVDPGANPLPTPSGRIEISSARIGTFDYADCPSHPAWFEPAEWLGQAGRSARSLHLISSQPKTRLHSQHDHAALSQETKVKGREPLTMNTADAVERGIKTGDIVRVFNERGACLAGALVSDAVRPGVVRLATGAWYDPVEPGQTGALDAHGNPNVLTLDKGTSRLAQAPSAMTACVEVERLTGEAPPVHAHVPPKMARM